MGTNVYEIVTNNMIEKLKAGTVPWKQPWTGTGLPMNLISKKPYRGINQFLLGLSGYSTPYWLTLKQANSLGGHIRKGEKSSIIVFWKWLENKDNGEKFPLLRYYRGFNLDQCEGLDEKKDTVMQELEAKKIDFKPIDSCEKVVKEWRGKPRIENGVSQACYSPFMDKINMPAKEEFHSEEEYYSTLFHELTHSTGHEKRLKREGIVDLTGFGSHKYSKEELIAEMGASFLAAYCQIDNHTIDNSAAYINGWLSVLKAKGSAKLIVEAAAKAQKASDMILNIQFQDWTAQHATK